MSAPQSKRQRVDSPHYELLYHPGIPGRGEFIRLMFEAAEIKYSDPANEDPPSEAGLNGYSIVKDICDPESLGDDDGNPPVLAPPALRVKGAGKSGKALVVHQTPAIMEYLGKRLGLAGQDEVENVWVSQIALTALDMNNECHDTHHPLAVSKYYEDQKEAALEKAKDFRETRVPKFFSYFEHVLKHNETDGKGEHLVGSKVTYADTTVWQLLDGLKFAFPKEMEARSKDFPLLFERFYPGLKEEKWLKSYLDSERRLPYSMGVFRYYPELDRQ